MSQTVTQVKDIPWLNLPDGKVTVNTAKQKVAKAPVKKKKVGVVGISKAENDQLGLLLKWIALDTDWDTIPNDVLTDPEALTKLFGRFKTSQSCFFFFLNSQSIHSHTDTDTENTDMKTAYFLLKTSVRENYEISQAARDIEQQAEAVCVDYMWLDAGNDYPYIAH